MDCLDSIVCIVAGSPLEEVRTSNLASILRIDGGRPINLEEVSTCNLSNLAVYCESTAGSPINLKEVSACNLIIL